MSFILASKIIFVNFSPALKRLFWWLPEVYALISYAAALVAFRSKVKVSAIFVSVILVTWVSINGSPGRAFLQYGPILFLLIFSESRTVSELSSIFWKIRALFLLSILYAAYVKIFGFLPYEISWINSGLGMVRAEGFFVTEEVRPMSFYAGIPEFGFLSSIYVYFSFKKRSYIFFILGICGIYLAGSRGIMVSFVVAAAMAFLYYKYASKKLVILGFSCAVLMYLFFAIILPETGFLEVKDDTSRLLVYGTLGYRFSVLLDFFLLVNMENIWLGVGSDRVIFDNFYLTLLNDFGLIGLCFFLYWLISSATNSCSMFFVVLVMSYLLYSDALYSVYFAYNFFLLLNCRDNLGSITRSENRSKL